MMIALPDPPAPVAETVSVPDAVIFVGAVYRPAEVTDPAAALHVVTLLAENCWVAPRVTVAVAGVTVSFGTKVIVAEPLPPGPVALIVSVPEAGIETGAV